jgi:hypothetical protein
MTFMRKLSALTKLLMAVPLCATVALLLAAGQSGTNSAIGMGSVLGLAANAIVYSGGPAAAPLGLTMSATARFPLLSGASAAPTWATIQYPSSVTQWGIMYASSSTALASTSALTANALIKAGSSAAPSASSIVDNATFVKTSEIVKGGNTQLLTSNSSGVTATTPGTTIFTWGALPVSTNFSFHCAGTYSQATAANTVGIAVQGATNAPTRIDAWGELHTTNTGTSSQGSLANLTSTTATSVLSGSPGVVSTTYQWTFDGTVQVGASATTLNILFYTGSASDAVTVLAGSYCTLMP